MKQKQTFFLVFLVLLFFIHLSLPLAVLGQDNADTKEKPAEASGTPQKTSPADDQVSGSGKEGADKPAGTLSVVKLFSWYTEPKTPAWNIGVFYAFLGLIGALVTVFTFVGGALPGTVGKARIEYNEGIIKLWTEELDKLIRSKEKKQDEINAVGGQLEKLRKHNRSLRHNQFWIAGAINLVLGAFFACAIAQDIFQALFIGVAWTTMLGTFGLKADYAERSKIKGEYIENLEKTRAPEVKKVEEVVREVVKEMVKNNKVMKGEKQDADTSKWITKMIKNSFPDGAFQVLGYPDPNLHLNIKQRGEIIKNL